MITVVQTIQARCMSWQWPLQTMFAFQPRFFLMLKILNPQTQQSTKQVARGALPFWGKTCLLVNTLSIIIPNSCCFNRSLCGLNIHGNPPCLWLSCNLHQFACCFTTTDGSRPCVASSLQVGFVELIDSCRPCCVSGHLGWLTEWQEAFGSFGPIPLISKTNREL